MKILYLHTLYPPHVAGGAEGTVEALARGMAARGHRVAVLATGPEAGLCEEVVDGVRVFRSGVRNLYWHYDRKRTRNVLEKGVWHSLDMYNPFMTSAIRAVIGRERPDIVSVHNLAGWSCAAWQAVKASGCPILQVLHELYLLCPRGNMFWKDDVCQRQCFPCQSLRCVHRRLSRAVDGVVGVSRFVVDRHLEMGFFPNARVAVAIHNARPMPSRADPGTSVRRAAFRFGYLGTLSKAKGIELLLDAFARVRALKGDRAELWIAGLGKEAYVEGLRRRCNDGVRWLGFTAPDAFFPGIDVLVVPSLLNEGLGNVVFESFGYGVPVIGSRRGGIPEMVSDGIQGYLFDPGDPQDLQKLMVRMMREDGGIGQLRRGAAEAARPFFDMDGWLSRYEQVMLEVGAGRVPT